MDSIETLILESRNILKELNVKKPSVALMLETIFHIQGLDESSHNERLYNFIFKKFTDSKEKDFDKFIERLLLEEPMTGASISGIDTQTKSDLKVKPEQPVKDKKEYEEGEETPEKSENKLPRDVIDFLSDIGLADMDEKGSRVFLFRFKDIIREYIKDEDAVNLIVYLLYSARFNEPLSEGEILELQDIIKKFTNDPKKEVQEQYKRFQEADPEDEDENESEDLEPDVEEDNSEEEEKPKDKPKESPKKDNKKSDNKEDDEEDEESEDDDDEEDDEEDTRTVVKKKSKDTSDDDEDNKDEKKSKFSKEEKIGIIATMVVGTLLFGIGGLLVAGLMAVIAGQSDEDYEESKEELTDEDTKEKIENGEEPDEDKVEKVKEKPEADPDSIKDPYEELAQIKKDIEEIKQHILDKAKEEIKDVTSEEPSEDENSEDEESDEEESSEEEETPAEEEPKEEKPSDPNQQDGGERRARSSDPESKKDEKETDAETMEPSAYKKKWGKCPAGWRWDKEKNACVKSTSESVELDEEYILII